MDLAKIRKKLKEKELDKREKEETGSGSPEAEQGHEGQESRYAQADGSGERKGLQRAGVEETPEGVGQAEDLEEETLESPVKLVEFLVFTLAEEHYAFRLSDLQEVMREQIITSVPKMPDFISGITSLRGKIVPVMDLDRRLGIRRGVRRARKGQMLIVKGPKGLIGVIIDKVVGVKRIEESLITEPPSHLDENQLSLIDSVVRDENLFLSILNIKEVLNFGSLSIGRRA
jgi:purine-binding chemotaxis protein CheW